MTCDRPLFRPLTVTDVTSHAGFSLEGGAPLREDFWKFPHPTSGHKSPPQIILFAEAFWKKWKFFCFHAVFTDFLERSPHPSLKISQGNPDIFFLTKYICDRCTQRKLFFRTKGWSPNSALYSISLVSYYVIYNLIGSLKILSTILDLIWLDFRQILKGTNQIVDDIITNQ